MAYAMSLLRVRGVLMLGCVWDTLENWETLGALDPGTLISLLPHGGDTYFRVCADGTIYMNETLFYAFQGV